MWKLIVGGLFAIGGVANLASNPAACIIGILICAGFVYWYLRTNQRCSRCGKIVFEKLSHDRICKNCVEEQSQFAAQHAAEKAALEAKQAAEYQTLIDGLEYATVTPSEKKAPKLSMQRLDEVRYSNVTVRTDRQALGNFTVVDVETTGLHAMSCDIIELAAVRFRNFEPICVYTALTSPRKPINPDSIKIHGITDEMVEGKPSFRTIASDLQNFLGSDNIVGHNLPFDLGFLLTGGCDFLSVKRKYYDTFKIARNLLERGVDVENHKLPTLCTHYNICNPSAHRSLGDAIATGYLLKMLADERERVCE